MDLKVLVWDGSFGADVKEMRMPLPELYPSSSTPYDQNEDFAARTLEEAIVSQRCPQSSFNVAKNNSAPPKKNTRLVHQGGRRWFCPHQQVLWPPQLPLYFCCSKQRIEARPIHISTLPLPPPPRT